MTDVSETDRGWQNVARTILAHLGTFRLLDGETLTEREAAEQAAWTVAHAAVVDQIVERNAEDGDGADHKS